MDNAQQRQGGSGGLPLAHSTICRSGGRVPVRARRATARYSSPSGSDSVRCSFEAILEDYKLTDPALNRLGLIVRGADVTGQEHVAPESLGLRAIAHGFAATRISDEERLEKEFPIYDALLEYVRQQLNRGTAT